MTVKELAQENVGVCVSGGLSSLAVVAALAESGVPVTAFVADIGQADPDAVRVVAKSLEAAGVTTVVEDLRDQMADMALDIARYQAGYEGGYWNTTSASRLVLVAGLTEAMRRHGCTALAHGCVGGGNDQRRFERYTAAFAPDLRVISPWTEPDLLRLVPDRSAMRRYVAACGLACDPRCTEDYSVDGNLAGFAHEGTLLERLETPDSVTRTAMAVPARQAPDEPEVVTVRLDHGRPAEVGGIAGGARELLERANALAGRHGVGLRSVVENRINGTKCRGMYEAPGLDLLGFCADRLYQVTMGHEAKRLMRSMSELIGRGIYEGRYDDPATRAARAAADVLIGSAGAEVEVELYKGHLAFHGISEHTDEPLPPRQTRFTGGGHFWQVVA